MSKVRSQKESEKIEAIGQLRKLLKPGGRVYTVLRHVSSSGMSRRIDLYTIKGGQLVYLSGYVSKALDYRRHPRENGLVVSGCGMDMGFHLVYELGSVLWPKGTSKPHSTRNGEPDHSGGYALKQEWI